MKHHSIGAANIELLNSNRTIKELKQPRQAMSQLTAKQLQSHHKGIETGVSLTKVGENYVTPIAP